MTCEEYLRLLDQTDGISEDERGAMREHESACPSCAEIARMRDDLAHLDEGIEVPNSFAMAWRRQIREDQSMERTERKSRPWLKWVASAAAVVFLIGGTLATRDSWIMETKPSTAVNDTAVKSGNGGIVYSTMSTRDMAYEESSYARSEPEMPAVAMLQSESDTGVTQTAKIIREASFTIKTQTFDSDYDAILSLVSDLGGRVSYSNVTGDVNAGTLRTARLTLRIPTEKLDKFLAQSEGVGEMINMTQSSEDVSEAYYDLEARLNAQIAKMERLIELMGMTDSVDELIDVESAIADTQYLIDSYQSRLKGYDSRVEDSQVSVTMREVRVAETVSASLGDKIISAIGDSLEEFVNFLQDMLIFLLVALPWLAAMAVVIVIVVVIIKKKRRVK